MKREERKEDEIVKAEKYIIRSGVGVSGKALPSFDKALLEAGVGNYNLVRLSSILPAKCKEVDEIDIPEGSLLPTAYATITSDVAGEKIASAIGIGIPTNKENVGVIMEYSGRGKTAKQCIDTVHEMVKEAFDERGWELEKVNSTGTEAIVGENEIVTTFACVAEW